MTEKLNVGILLFNEVEVLDFAGPFEVFSITESSDSKTKLFNTFTVSERDELIHARNNLLIKPNFTFKNCPPIDILIVPGGAGAEEVEINNEVLLDWLKAMFPAVKTIASVCTGAFLLAKAGIITDHKVTTHWVDIERLKTDFPDLNVVENTKFTDQGKILTSAGISAGIELSLYLVMRYHGPGTAEATARRMEYEWDSSGFE